MKQFLILLFSVLAITKADATVKPHHHAACSDSTTCLEIRGIAMDGQSKPIDGVEVRLFKENEELEWSEISNVSYHEHSFIYKLEANSYYTIEVSKKGYVTRSVAVSTKLPSDISLTRIFQYEFEVALFEEKNAGDDFYLDFPVAIVSYDQSKEVFINNLAYTRHIKTMIQKTTPYKCNKTTITQK